MHGGVFEPHQNNLQKWDAVLVIYNVSVGEKVLQYLKIQFELYLHYVSHSQIFHKRTFNKRVRCCYRAIKKSWHHPQTIPHNTHKQTMRPCIGIHITMFACQEGKTTPKLWMSLLYPQICPLPIDILGIIFHWAN